MEGTIHIVAFNPRELWIDGKTVTKMVKTPPRDQWNGHLMTIYYEDGHEEEVHEPVLVEFIGKPDIHPELTPDTHDETSTPIEEESVLENYAERKQEYNDWQKLKEEVSTWRGIGYKSDSVAWALRTGNPVSLEVATKLTRFYTSSIDADSLRSALKDGTLKGSVPEVRTQKVRRWNKSLQEYEETTREQPVGHYEFDVRHLITMLDANYTRRTSGSSVIDKYLDKIISNTGKKGDE